MDDRSEEQAESPSDIDVPPERRTPPGRFRILAHPYWAGIGVIVAVLLAVAGAIWLNDAGDTTVIPAQPPSTATSPPEDIIDQIARRDIWISPPQLLATAADLASIEPDQAQVFDGDVVVVTPAELVREAATYDGEPVYLVGRVEQVRQLIVPGRYEFGGPYFPDFVFTEVRLKATDGVNAYIGTDDLYAPEEGDVIYSLGQIAAVGETRSPTGGPRLSSTYFVTVADIAAIETYDQYFPPGSKNLRDALAAAA